MRSSRKNFAEVIVDFLEPFQEKFASIADGEIMNILEEGKEKAGKMAREKMEIVKEKIGLL